MKLKSILAAVSTAVLVACGGGGGGAANVDAPPALPAWQGDQTLESGPDQAFAASVAINSSGIGYAAWTQQGAGRSEVFASRYRNGVWEAAQLVFGNADADVSGPEVVVLPDGRGLVVFQETLVAGNTQSLSFMRSDESGTWGGKGLLQAGVSGVDGLTLRSNAKGDAIAIWSQKTTPAANPSIHAATFSSDGAVAVAEVSFGTTTARTPDIAIDADGDALAAWAQFNGNLGFDTIHVRNFVGGFWGAELEVAKATHSSEPSVALGRDGAAAVAWTVDAQDDLFVRTNPKFQLGNWDFDAVNLTADEEGLTSRSRLAVDAQGTVTVVWQQTEGGAGAVTSLRSSRGSGVTFAAPEKVETDDAGGTALHEIAVDAAGRVMVVWQQVVGPAVDLLSNRLDPATGRWGIPEAVERAGGNSLFASLAMNPEGRAIAAWEQKSAVNSTVMANVFK